MDITTDPAHISADIIVPNPAGLGEMAEINLETLILFAQAYIATHHDIVGQERLARWGFDFATAIVSQWEGV